MVDVYELLSLFGKRVASLKLTSLSPSLVLTLYVVTAANSCPQAAWAVYTLMANAYESLSPRSCSLEEFVA